jgi:hypothetical protein
MGSRLSRRLSPCETHEDGECRVDSPQVVDQELIGYAAVPRICRSRDRGEDLLAALAKTKER